MSLPSSLSEQHPLVEHTKPALFLAALLLPHGLSADFCIAFREFRSSGKVVIILFQKETRAYNSRPSTGAQAFPPTGSQCPVLATAAGYHVRSLRGRQAGKSDSLEGGTGWEYWVLKYLGPAWTLYKASGCPCLSEPFGPNTACFLVRGHGLKTPPSLGPLILWFHLLWVSSDKSLLELFIKESLFLLTWGMM